MEQNTTKKLKNLNIKIEEELLKQFKIKTTENNKKMVEVIRECILNYIKK